MKKQIINTPWTHTGTSALHWEIQKDGHNCHWQVDKASSGSFDLEQAFELISHIEPKAWGEEWWFSGFEKRGSARIRQGDSECDLAFLAVFTENLFFSLEKAPILLKILNPLPDPLWGQLYFEMHREKEEVYVVTKTNSDKAAIRFGFKPDKLKSYPNREVLKNDFLTKIKDYRVVRLKIDQLLFTNIDEAKKVSSEEKNLRYQKIPDALKMEEQRLRQEVEAFIHFKALRTGDVVRVPKYLPHGLLHGVQTIEFQTPHYEREIIYFNQKTLTQDHWDSEQALSDCLINTPEETERPVMEQTADFVDEEIVQYESFTAVKCRHLNDKPRALKQKNSESYVILFLLKGRLEINVQGKLSSFKKGQAVFLPICNLTGNQLNIVIHGKKGCEWLYAYEN